MKHANIPIFIPHLGCPNNCVFCNQKSISGRVLFDEKTVIPDIENALKTIAEGNRGIPEIAFFGGSFTGIDRTLMVSLLEDAYPYVKSGKVSGIRLSTRPDYISTEILDILGKYGVKTIELGLQSMSDRVLEAAKRGHTSADAEKACKLIKDYGFDLVGQMMIGLPASDSDDEIETAKKICELGADAARVYPTVVFYDTELCSMAEKGEYKPLSNEEAVVRTKNVLAVFDKYKVPCIRVGLCASENLSSDETVYGGANHSAIGELAMGELFLDKLCAAFEDLPDLPKDKKVIIYVPMGAVSKVIGQKSRNIAAIKDKYFVKKSVKSVKVLEKKDIFGYNIKIVISGETSAEE